MRKLIVFMLSFIMVVLPMTAMAEVGGTTNPIFSDMPEDWSTEALQNAIENGLLTGFDGKLMPKDNLTRAQMAAIINRAFGATKKASLEMFGDVKPGDWFYDEMAKAVAMGTFKGDGNKLNPNNPITREEAFVVIARALKLESSNVVPAGLSDLGNVSEWARGEVYALINAGYISGSNGLLSPKASITRAEFAQVMYNTIKTYLSTPTEYTSLPKGNVIIKAGNITLKNLTIDGDLIIGEGVDAATIVLENVIITGRLVVKSSGISNVVVRGGSIAGGVIGEVAYEELEEEEEPKTETPSKDDDDDDRETKLRLRSASMGDAEVEITGNTIDVYFDLNEEPGLIEAVFNKRVKIVEISTNKAAEIEFEDVEETVGEDLPEKGYTLEMPIATVITQNHLDFFGDTVYLTVRDNDGQELEFTINLIPN